MGSRKTGGGVENVYRAAEKWVDCALRKDGSLFTPDEPIWTSQWLGELRRRFLDRHDEWKGPRFFEKLEPLLTDSRPEVIQLMAEAAYVTYLMVWKSAVGKDAKQRRINQVLKWSPSPVSIPDDLINGLEPGIAHPGAFFIANFAIHPGFVIEFVEQWKEKDSDEHDRLLTDPWAFRSFVTGLNFRSAVLRNAPNSPAAQREALYHLVHPDTFEGIVNAGVGSTKSNIAYASAFTQFVTETTHDVDRRINQIRNGLEAELERDFDFFDPEIRSRWDSSVNPWDEFVGHAKEYMRSGQLQTQEINYKIEIGQRLSAAREAVLVGEDGWASLLESALPSGNPLDFRAKARFCEWVDTSPDESLSALRALWTPDDSSVAERIKAFCDRIPRSAVSRPGTLTTLVSVLLMGLNAKEYPPYRTTTFREAYRRTGYEVPDGDADEVALHAHALGFLDRLIQEAHERELSLRDRLDAQSVVYAITGEPLPPPPPPCHNGLHALADELTLPVEFLEEIETLLDDKKQVIFQGPPGTGKTFVAQKLANHLAGSKDRVTLVQFHPSYSYEDFVQGFRPTILDSGQPGFKLMDGPLLRAAKSAKETGAKHFLIIDEINRGSLARILGELYFLLEYRDEKISLQYQSDTDEEFSLPDNLYIIGTMNTADRSIALVDLALRRRFYFVDFHPDDDPVNDVLRNWLKKNADSMDWVAGVVEAANEKLRDYRHAAIGPSHFMKSGISEVMVERIWKHSVLPYIEERLFGEGEERIREFDLDKLRPPVTSDPQPGSGSQGEDSAQDDGNTA